TDGNQHTLQSDYLPPFEPSRQHQQLEGSHGLTLPLNTNVGGAHSRADSSFHNLSGSEVRPHYITVTETVTTTVTQRCQLHGGPSPQIPNHPIISTCPPPPPCPT
ncbi:unnamed protein product, partial [Meganyctiphanes norvegica]